MTMYIAFLFCIGVAVGFCFRFARWKYFRRIMATGILSVLLSVLPMAAGVAMGKGLQGSLYWGLSVINGDSSDTEDTSENEAAQKQAMEEMAARLIENTQNSNSESVQTGEIIPSHREILFLLFLVSICFLLSAAR